MATRIPTIATPELGVNVITWTGLLNGDDGTPVEMVAAADRSVQISGTFGTGGTVLVEGTNLSDASGMINLTDPQGNPISKTAAAIEQVQELTRFIRPRVSAGDGTTSITVTMLVKTSL